MIGQDTTHPYGPHQPAYRPTMFTHLPLMVHESSELLVQQIGDDNNSQNAPTKYKIQKQKLNKPTNPQIQHESKIWCFGTVAQGRLMTNPSNTLTHTHTHTHTEKTLIKTTKEIAAGNF